MKRILAVVYGSLLALNACAQIPPEVPPTYEANSGLIFVGLFMLYYDSEGPLSYQNSMLQEVPKGAIRIGEVRGDSCQYGLSIPIPFTASDRISISGAVGDGSYREAIENIRERYPELDGLYDVKVDIHRRSILTIWNRNCTIVVAHGFKRADSNGDSTSASK